jgi:hypothetical protein
MCCIAFWNCCLSIGIRRNDRFNLQVLTFVAALTGILAVVLTLSTSNQNVNQEKSSLENSPYVKKINLMNENTEL